MKCLRLLLVSFLLLSVYSLLPAQTYSVTEEQLQQLEKNSKDKEIQIEMLNSQLLELSLQWNLFQTESENKIKELENQLTESQKQLNESLKKNKKIETYLSRLEVKNYLINISFGVIGFATGYGVCKLVQILKQGG